MRPTVTPAVEHYDSVAAEYDSLYLTLSDQGENELVRRLVQWETGGASWILDLGAGTGLLLDLAPHLTTRTVCVDPSARMLEQLHAKHPKARILQSDHTVDLTSVVDCVLSLFGSPSYIPPDDVAPTLHRLLVPGGNAVLMFGALSHPGARFLNGADDPGFTRWSVEDVHDRLGQCFESLWACQVGNFTVAVGEALR